MKAFITGGTGFIGRRLIERLSQSGCELRCLVRRTGPAGEQLERLGATLVPGDITDRSSVLRGMQGCDVVLHLADLYSFWEPRRDVFRRVNVLGTRNVMETALETGIAKVVHVSTLGVYGKSADCPFREESAPGAVRFCEYFETKHEGDEIVWDLRARRGLPAVVVYPGAVLGPGDEKASGQYIMNLIGRRLPATVFDDGVLTYVHVNDAAEIIARAAEKSGNAGERYFAAHERLSFRELNAMVSEISGVPLPLLRLPDLLTRCNAVLLTGLANTIKRPPLWGLATDQVRVMRRGFQGDGSKAERELGIKYTPIRVALEEAIASYR
ncbi:MAG: NAD-dependent epimerase/dehydratase family protein [Candidatus Solibacter usitatus]|nr:NAD-dependent epimerase/dehydratase family protein [Candidatus Solibacter usitatus]